VKKEKKEKKKKKEYYEPRVLREICLNCHATALRTFARNGEPNARGAKGLFQFVDCFKEHQGASFIPSDFPGIELRIASYQLFGATISLHRNMFEALCQNRIKTICFYCSKFQKIEIKISILRYMCNIYDTRARLYIYNLCRVRERERERERKIIPHPIFPRELI